MKKNIAVRKNSNTGLLLGVCSGLSEWFYRNKFPINVWVVRAFFIVSCVYSIGLICVAYLFLANTLTDEAECNTED